MADETVAPATEPTPDDTTPPADAAADETVADDDGPQPSNLTVSGAFTVQPPGTAFQTAGGADECYVNVRTVSSEEAAALGAEHLAAVVERVSAEAG